MMTLIIFFLVLIDSFFIIHAFHFDLRIISVLMVVALHSHLHQFFLLSKLPSHDVLLIILLTILILSCLLVLHGLETHPVLVTIGFALLSQVFLYLFAAIQISHVRHFLSLIDLLPHKPLVHSSAPFLVLLSLLLRYGQQLLLDLILSLVRQLASYTLFSILDLDPLLVGQTVSSSLFQILTALGRLLGRADVLIATPIHLRERSVRVIGVVFLILDL